MPNSNGGRGGRGGDDVVIINHTTAKIKYETHPNLQTNLEISSGPYKIDFYGFLKEPYGQSWNRINCPTAHIICS